MPVDSRIPLGINYQPSDPVGQFQQGFEGGQKIQNAPLERRKLQAGAQDAEIDVAGKKLGMLGQLLGSVKDQATWDKARQIAIQSGIGSEQEIPQQYDPNSIPIYKNYIDTSLAGLKRQQLIFQEQGGTQGAYTRQFGNPNFDQNYMFQKNAGKGLIPNASTGKMETAPGYNEATASTKEAEAAAGASGKIRGETEGAKTKRELNAPNNLMLIAEAEKLLPQATSGLASRAMRGVAGIAGVSTEASKADRKLNVLAAALTSGVPRMEGPQSDKDTAMYKQAAGDVGNPDVPYEDRLAALQTMRELQEKYQGVAQSGPEENTNNVNNAPPKLTKSKALEILRARGHKL